MQTLKRLFKALNIQEHEIPLVGLLFIYSVLIGIMRIFALIPSISIFLERYSAAQLPYVYILAGIVTVPVGAIYLRLGRVMKTVPLVIMNLAFLGGVTLLFRIGLGMEGTKWPALAFLGWYFLLFSLSSLSFWNIASLLLDVRQGKRLFALITTGEVLALATGGILGNVLVRFVSAADLIYFSVLAAMLGVGMIFILKRKFPDNFSQESPKSTEPQAKHQKTGKQVVFTRYTLLLMAYFCISEFLFFFIDNAFNDVVRARYSSAEKLAQFFGLYNTVVALTGFVMRFFIAGPVLKRFGIIVGLMAMPLLLMVGSSIVVIGGMYHLALIIFFAMFMTKVTDRTMRGIQFSSLVTLYKPLLNRAGPTQNFTEGMAVPFAGGLAGLLLLILFEWFQVDATHLSMVSALIALTWVWVAWLVYQEYVKLLPKTLIHRRVEGMNATGNNAFNAPLLDMDDTTVKHLIKELESEHANRVIHAMDYLEEIEYPKARELLLKMLQHKDVHVVIEGIRRIEKYHYEPGFKPILQLLQHLESPQGSKLPVMQNPDNQSLVIQLKANAIRVLCTLGQDGVKTGLEFLKSSQTELQQGAIVGLLRSGNIAGVVKAGAILMDELESKLPEKRYHAAKLLAESEISEFHQAVSDLMKDPVLEVRLAALEAAGQLKHPYLIAGIVELLQQPETMEQATKALSKCGVAALPEIEKLLNSGLRDEFILLKLIRLVGMMKDKQTLPFLLRHLHYPDEDIRHAVIIALDVTGYHPGHKELNLLEKEIKKEVADAIWALSAMADLEHQPECEQLLRALNSELNQNRKRIILLLSFIFDRQKILQTWYNYGGGDKEKRSYALETLENLIPRAIKQMIFPLLEDGQATEILEQLIDEFPHQRLTPEDRVMELLQHDNKWITTWTKCCAIEVAAKTVPTKCEQPLVELLTHGEQVVCEMAIWGLWRANAFILESATFREKLSIPIKRVLMTLKSAGDYVPITQKTAFLKRIQLFDKLDELVLFNLIPALQEEVYQAGETVFEKDDDGDALYVIKKGEVEVIIDEHRRFRMTEGDFFGEFTVLVQEPRTATVKSTTQTLLYKLNKDFVYSLVSDNIEIAKSLIQVILMRLVKQKK